MTKTKPNKSGLAVTIWKTADIKAYKKQLRRHHEEAVERMRTCIEKYGFKIPILVSVDGQVIDGHLRLTAAQTLGWTELPVIVCEGWSQAQIRGFRIMANKSAEWADWDINAVREEIMELDADLFDLDLTGFDTYEITDLFFDCELGEQPKTEKKKDRGDVCPLCNRKLPAGGKR